MLVSYIEGLNTTEQQKLLEMMYSYMMELKDDLIREMHDKTEFKIISFPASYLKIVKVKIKVKVKLYLCFN
jgi:hypothetical protein